MRELIKKDAKKIWKRFKRTSAEKINMGDVAREVAKDYQVSYNIVYRWQRMLKDGVLYEKKTPQRGPQKIDLVALENIVTRSPQSKLREMAEQLGCAASTVGKWLNRFGYSYKK